MPAKPGLRGDRGWRMLCPMKPDLPSTIDSKLLEDPLFKELVAEGLRIQHRFSAEPVYARTGKGYLKSEGIEELQRIKAKTKPAGK
jgi:hypothetical protein